MQTILHKIKLKPNVSPEVFDQWVKEKDYPGCPELKSLLSFHVAKLDGESSGGDSQFMEIICVTSYEAFEADMKTDVFKKLVEEFTQMAEVTEEIRGVRVGDGYQKVFH